MFLLHTEYVTVSHIWMAPQLPQIKPDLSGSTTPTYPLVPTNYLLALRLEPEAGTSTVPMSHILPCLCALAQAGLHSTCTDPHFTSQLHSQGVKTSPPRPFPPLAFLRHARFHPKPLDCPEISGKE
jgi:hypothetical protein